MSISHQKNPFKSGLQVSVCPAFPRYQGGIDQSQPIHTSLEKIGQLITKYKNHWVWRIYSLENKISMEIRKMSIEPAIRASLPTTAGD